MSESTLVKQTGVEQGNLSREQYNYAVAKALYDGRKAAYEMESAVPPRGQVGDAVFQQAIAEDDQLFKRHRVQEAFEIMVQAEDQLIAWGDKCARRNLGKQRYRQIEDAFKLGAGAGMKDRLIKICMQMRDERRAG
jgi:hypothetical protein